MNEQNPLEQILYGDNYGKRTLSQFREEGRVLREKIERTQKDQNRSTPSGTDTLRRMENSYKRRKRQKKIEKLQSTGEWSGLE